MAGSSARTTISDKSEAQLAELLEKLHRLEENAKGMLERLKESEVRGAHDDDHKCHMSMIMRTTCR